MNHGFGWGHDASPDFALYLQTQRTAGPSVPTIAAPFCAPGEPPAELDYWASAPLAHVGRRSGVHHGPWMPWRIDNRTVVEGHRDRSGGVWHSGIQKTEERGVGRVCVST